jgi:hypothetical protein
MVCVDGEWYRTTHCQNCGQNLEAYEALALLKEGGAL